MRTSGEEFNFSIVLLFSPRLSSALLTFVNGGAHYRSDVHVFGYIAMEVEVGRVLSLPRANALVHFQERLHLLKTEVLLCHLQFAVAWNVCE